MRTSRVLDHWEIVFCSDIQNSGQVAGHARLVHQKDRFGSRSYGRFNQVRIDVLSARINIHEDWTSAAVANRIGSRNERMAHRDDFIAGTYIDRQESQM